MSDPSIILYGAIALLALSEIRAAFKTGKVGYLFGETRRTRDDNPILFWGTIAFWLLVVGICTYRILAL